MTDVESSARNRLEKQPAVDGVEEEAVVQEEEEEEEPYATSAIFVNTEDAGTGQRDKSEKDLNSPDSNDSGIQADSQSFQHLSDDLDLYAVVKKTKKKGAKDHHAPEEPAESTEEPLTVTLSKEDGIRAAREEEEIDDPYTAVEFDSEEKEEVFSLIQKKKKVPRTEEQDDDGDEISNPDLNGNIRLHANDSDEKDDDDKLSDSSDLPEGWQRHEDEQGSYYWHIKSGITQRDPPSPVLQHLPAAKLSNAKAIHSTKRDAEAKLDTKKDTHEPLEVKCVKSKSSRQNVSATKVDDSSQSGFHVRCLGSLPLTEDELSDDRSGQAINQCISSLSHRPGVLQNGTLQGLSLYLEFSGEDLLLIDVNSSTVVRSESVRSVRVWGVGKEKDSRDFAYVARDPDSGKHICSVFKCERTGHEVASALRSICVRILNENESHPGKKSSATRVNENAGNHLVFDSRVSKDSLKNQTKNGPFDQSKKNWNGQSKLWNDSVVFPVPMSESKKVINCHYLGMMKVPKPLGMEILNDAIEMVHSRVPSSKWVAVSVEVAPSAVTVYDRGRANSVILECRIRFLTFLGIGINNCRLGAFIMHSAQDEFFAHVFHCIPDAGVFCRTVKAACKLRYQKCLDAQNQKDRDQSKFSHQTSTGSTPPFQVLKESLQKGVNNLLSGYGKNK